MASGCYWLFTDSVLGGRGRIRFRKQGMRSGGVWQTDNATSHFSWSLTCWVLNTAPLKRHTANLLEVDGISVQSFCWRSLFTWMGLFIDFPELHAIAHDGSEDCRNELFLSHRAFLVHAHQPLISRRQAQLCGRASSGLASLNTFCIVWGCQVAIISKLFRRRHGVTY